MTQSLQTLRNLAQSTGQEHLFACVDTLDDTSITRLLTRIEALDLQNLPALLDQNLHNTEPSSNHSTIEPIPYYPLERSGARAWERDSFRRVGEQLLREGKIAAFIVAGGQGSRLGFEGPKGCFPGGAVTGKPLFQCITEWIVASQRKYDCTIPLYVMTSPLNHQDTIQFFQNQEWLGLQQSDVMFFQQGILPSVDKDTGKILLAAPDEPATNPDGHGGSLKALWSSGAIKNMRERGIEHVSYAQVDNPLVRVIDPVFIGLHAKAEDSSGQMSTKMIAKTDPHEKVGVFATLDGKAGMIEYSDLPEHLATKQTTSGELAFNAGNPAIHMLGVEFIASLNSTPSGCALPFHRAIKKVPYVDLETGDRIEPSEPNALKLETFVFDALPLCDDSIVMEVDRIEEFAPIKNAKGDDSAHTSSLLQTLRAARWLEAAGVQVPRHKDGTPDCTLEISPLTAMESRDLLNIEFPAEIKPGSSFAL